MIFQVTITHADLDLSHVVEGIDKALRVATWVQRFDIRGPSGCIRSLLRAKNARAKEHDATPASHHVKKQLAAFEASRARTALILAMEERCGKDFPI